MLFSPLELLPPPLELALASLRQQLACLDRLVLAYSGGLDTSVILKWLQDAYGCEVVTFTADIGQGEELSPARAKAIRMGIKREHISSTICAKNSCATSCFRCFAPMPCTRANTCWAPRSRGH